MNELRFPSKYWWHIRGTVAGSAVLVSVFGVARFTLTTPDGQDYLRHAADLAGTGLVQLGYRQVGYPLFLAAVNSAARSVGIDAIQATVIVQRVLALAAVGLLIWVLRWWATPAVVVLLMPSMAIYGNFILTESIGIPLAAVGASSMIGYFLAENRSKWLWLASTIAVLLPIIRLHWAVVSCALCFGILSIAWSNRTDRRRAAIAVALVALVVATFTAALAMENRSETGIFHPSLGSQRQLFWITWATVGANHRETVRERLPEVYLDGGEYTFLVKTDNSGRSYSDREEVFAQAVNSIFSVTGVNPVAERMRSAVGVLGGARVDDLRLGSSPAVPTGLPSPSLHVVMELAVAATLVTATVLSTRRHARLLAIPALIVLLGYSVMSFAFPLDNLRFLLPGYVFALTSVCGAGLVAWHDRTLQLHFSSSGGDALTDLRSPD